MFLKSKKVYKSILLVGIIIVSISLFYQLFLKKYYPISFFIENPNVLKITINWDSLSKEEQEKQLVKDIEVQLSKNENIDEIVKESLLQNYKEYVNKYIEYYEGTDYLNTLLSSRYIKIKNLPAPADNEYLAILGVYDNNKAEIEATNLNTVFHEKIHADRSWGLENLKNNQFYEEIHNSFTSNDHSYEDIKAFFSLLSELLKNNSIEKNLFSKNYNQIWQDLKNSFSEYTKEIDELEKKIEELYRVEYDVEVKTPLEDIKAKKEEILKIYESLYQSKYNSLMSEDIIITFLKKSFLSQNPFYNENSLVYDKFKITENLYITEETRKGSYEEVLINYIIDNKETLTKYKYSLWKTLVTIKDNEENKYQKFLNNYIPYFSNDEIEDIFFQILNCTEQDYAYIAKYTIQKRNWRIENNGIF